MVLVALGFVFIGVLPNEHSQQEQDTVIREQIDRLSYDDVELRVAAKKALCSLPPSVLPTLKVRAKEIGDAEIRSRLVEVIRHLLLDEAESLFQKGELNSSLLKTAEGLGAEDPESYVRERVKEAKEFVKKIIPKGDIPSQVLP